MQINLVKTLIGIFALDEKRNVVLFKPFPKDPVKAAEKFSESEPEEYLQLKQEFRQNLTGGSQVIEEFVKNNLRKYAIEYKFVNDQVEFNQFLTKVNAELAKTKIRETANRDSLIIHANNAIDEIDKTANIYVERLREWYSLHFPEMDRTIDNHKNFAELIEKFGSREKIDDKKLTPFKDRSMGMEFTDDDISIIKDFASNVSKQYELREKLVNYVSNLLKEIAPNFTAIGGETVSAKLISKAGGLERLAKMPSSTIQLLGSEKALFRFLKSKGRAKSPKYGLIFNHPIIQNAPKEKQGKIARLLASKLSIAARIDFFSKEYKADEIKKELERKVKEILKHDDTKIKI